MMSDSDKHFLLDKQQVKRSFERAAEHYDEAAVLQREVANRMLERLDYMRIQPQVILDLGAGTGYVTQHLLQRYRKAQVLALDLAFTMLQRQRGQYSRWKPWQRKAELLCADAERLPLQDHSVEMIFSSLTIQWCNDLDRLFSEFRRVLKPGGMLLFSTFGPDTLKELRQSWSAVDTLPHVNEFIDMHDIGDSMLRAKLAEPVTDAERFTLTYNNVRDLMLDLKKIGAHNASAHRSRGLTGKRKLSAMQQAYESFRNDGTLPASYEVIYGHAWAGEKPVVEVAVDSLQSRHSAESIK